MDIEVRDFELPHFEAAHSQPEARTFTFTRFRFGDREPVGYAEGERNLRERAEQILQQARERAAQLERDAYEEGYARGVQEGRETSEKILAPVRARLQDLIVELETQKRDLYNRHEHDLLRLVLLMARRVIEREISLQTEIICQVMRSAWQYLSEIENIQLRLNPQDYEWLEGHKQEWKQDLSLLNHVTLIPDSRVSPGGLILEHPQGEIDASLESRWATVAQVVEEGLLKARQPAEKL